MPNSIQSPSFFSRRASQYFFKHIFLNAVTWYVQSCTSTTLGMNNKSDSFAVPQKTLNIKKTHPKHHDMCECYKLKAFKQFSEKDGHT